ncbi:MAG: extracellular solute-binding protein [Chloroflexi bacterium]|nr:extracellular solute-binding protein [Chloroflexota bacterium]
MSKENIILRGITWDHSRGFVSVVATGQRFHEMNPHIHIQWEKRSLQEFADYPIQKLINQYDLLVIDHPWAGYAAANEGMLLPLQDYLPAAYLVDQAAYSVGSSHPSYEFNGNHCALAIDAATPVAAYRPDVLNKLEADLPQTWDDLLVLARRGAVVVPGIPIDSLMNFYMLCSTLGQDPFVNDEWAVSETLGIQVLDMLRELANLCLPEIFEWNPIKVYEALSQRDDLAYCPFAYGYSNYSRDGYADNLLLFTDMVALNGNRMRSTLGGTGLAISNSCSHKGVAAAYAMFTASPRVQQTLFFENGGQPGHRSAWESWEVNGRSHNYFRNTLPALDRAYLRPRYPGYLHFQDNAGDPVRDYLMHGGDPKQTLAKMTKLYRESKEITS